MFSAKSFIVSGLTFRSLIHFEFIFVYGVRKCSSFILLQIVDQFSQHHLLKRLSFSYCIFLQSTFYTVSMSRRLCTQLISVIHLEGLVNSAIHTCCTFQLSFYSSNVINHFICDIPALLAHLVLRYIHPCDNAVHIQ